MLTLALIRHACGVPPSPEGRLFSLLLALEGVPLRSRRICKLMIEGERLIIRFADDSPFDKYHAEIASLRTQWYKQIITSPLHG